VADVVIDLGELALGGASSRPGLVRPPLRERFDRRFWPVGVVALALLLSVVGSAGEPRTLRIPLWSVPVRAHALVLTADALYLADLPRNQVRRFDAATGRPRWELATDSSVANLADLGHGVLGVTLNPLAPASGRPTSRDPRLVLVAEDTGRVIATVVGHLWRVNQDGSVIVIRNRADCMDVCVDLVRVEPTTGRVGASLTPTSGDLPSALPGEGDAIAVVGPTGAEIRSGPDLAVVGRVALPDPGGHDRQAALLHDRLVTAERREGAVLVNAAPLTGAATAWSVSLPEPAAVSAPILYFDSCADLLCVHTGDSTALIDPATGTVHRRLPFDAIVAPGQADPVAGPIRGGPAPPVLLAVVTPHVGSTQNSNDVVVLDTGGAVTATLAAAVPIDWVDGGGLTLLRQGVPRPGAQPGSAGDRSRFLTVDRGGRSQVLGAVDGTDLSCIARAALLACAAGDGVRVWHLPTAPR